MAGHGRHKKRRVAAPADEETARRAFLDALEAQRAKARKESAEKPPETAAPKAPAAPLPGFYYDETKRRYFRCSKDTEKLQREEVEAKRLQQLKIQQESVVIRRGRANRSRNWVDYLSRRQSDFGWRDRREFMPQLLSNFLSTQVVEAQDVQSDGRLTALALHPMATNLAATGSSSGAITVLGTQMLPPQNGVASESLRAFSMVTFGMRALVTSLQWRPVHELDLLSTVIGSRGNGDRTGGVVLIRAGDQDFHGIASIERTRTRTLHVVDPWITQWNPANPRKFSVGCGGTSQAAYVDMISARHPVQTAPAGEISSAVHAQSFFSTGQVVVNGTKNGGLWGWDLRSSLRAFEWEAEANTASSVVDIHMLDDCFRAVVQRSSGQLCLVDLRTYKPVVEFIPGARKQYLPSLRCSVDSSQAVVVAGGDMRRPRAVNSYDLRSGQLVASVEVSSSNPADKPGLVQQVRLKHGGHNSRYEGTPEIWALTRNELFLCSRRTDDPLN